MQLSFAIWLAWSLVARVGLGMSRSRYGLSLQPNNISAGDNTVVLCGVLWYYWFTVVSSGPSVIRLKVCTDLLVRLSEAGWCGDVSMCSFPFCVTNSELVKTDPLSDTIVYVSPWMINTFKSFATVTSGIQIRYHFHPLWMNIDNHKKHFVQEWSSVVSVNMWPWSLQPSPGMKWSLSRCWLYCLKLLTTTHSVLQLSIQVWPPNETSCQLLHSSATWMALTKKLESSHLGLWGQNQPSKWLNSFLHTNCKDSSLFPHTYHTHNKPGEV